MELLERIGGTGKSDSRWRCIRDLQTAVRYAERAYDSCLWWSQTQTPVACPDPQRFRHPCSHRCGTIAASHPRSSGCRATRNGIVPLRLRLSYKGRHIVPSCGRGQGGSEDYRVFICVIQQSLSSLFLFLFLLLLTFAATLSNLSSFSPSTTIMVRNFMGMLEEKGWGG